MAATSAPGQPTRCQLFEIAQELQDIIFDLAYPEEEKSINIITRTEKERQIKLTQMGNRVWDARGGPYPGNKVDTFLVSKRFFHSASKTWVKNQWFSAPSLGLVHGAPSAWATLLNTNGGILFRNLEKLEIASYMVCPRLMDAFPRLRRVKMSVSGSGRPYTRILEDAELVETNEYNKAIMFRGLVDCEFHYQRTGELGPDAIEGNMKRLRELVMPLVTRERLPLRSAPPTFDELPQYMGFFQGRVDPYEGGKGELTRNEPPTIGLYATLGVFVLLVAILMWALG